MENETRKSNSREKIVGESLKLFSLKGFHNTSISDILAATGMSKGGFYNHFKSKEELFAAVLSEARRIWRMQNLAGVDEADRQIDRLKKILANFRDRYLKDAVHFPGGCVFITLSVELDDQLPHLSSQLSDGFERTKALLRKYLDRAREAGEIRPDVSTSDVSEILFSGILGASVVYGLDKSDGQLGRNIQALIRYLEGIECRAQRPRRDNG